MENNKLIKTNTLGYKINSFFRNLFNFKKTGNEEYVKEQVIANNNPLRNSMEKNKSKRVLAENLLSGEVVISELTDQEIDEMTDYFTKDIAEIDRELLRIKENILRMKKKLADNR